MKLPERERENSMKKLAIYTAFCILGTIGFYLMTGIYIGFKADFLDVFIDIFPKLVLISAINFFIRGR